MKKKFKLIAIALVVVMAGGFGVMQFMGAGVDGEVEAPEPAYVMLEPLFAPVVSGHEFKGYVLLILQLELSDARNLSTVEHYIAPLRDAFIHDLHLQALLRRQDEPSINIHRVKKRFLLIAERVIGPGIISGVLIERALERRS